MTAAERTAAATLAHRAQLVEFTLPSAWGSLDAMRERSERLLELIRDQRGWIAHQVKMSSQNRS